MKGKALAGQHGLWCGQCLAWGGMWQEMEVGPGQAGPCRPCEGVNILSEGHREPWKDSEQGWAPFWKGLSGGSGCGGQAGGVKWQLWESERGASSCSLMLPVELRGGCTLGILSEDETHRS